MANHFNLDAKNAAVIHGSGHLGGGPLTKGRLVSPYSRTAHEFMFNPVAVELSHGWAWGRHKMYGNAFPVLSGGTGEDGTISFNLILDGDRGRSRARRANGGNDSSNANVSMDVASEIGFYLSLTMPDERTSLNASSGGSVAGATPSMMILTLGSLCTRVGVVMESVKISAKKFTPTLEVSYATLDIKLLIAPRFNKS